MIHLEFTTGVIFFYFYICTSSLLLGYSSTGQYRYFYNLLIYNLSHRLLMDSFFRMSIWPAALELILSLAFDCSLVGQYCSVTMLTWSESLIDFEYFWYQHIISPCITSTSLQPHRAARLGCVYWYRHWSFQQRHSPMDEEGDVLWNKHFQTGAMQIIRQQVLSPWLDSWGSPTFHPPAVLRG